MYFLSSNWVEVQDDNIFTGEEYAGEEYAVLSLSSEKHPTVTRGELTPLEQTYIARRFVNPRID